MIKNNKKINSKILLVIFLIFTIFLTGCNSEKKKIAKEEAKMKVTQYGSAFEEKVKEIYGNNVKLKNIKCEVFSECPGPVPSISYRSSDYLTAKLVMDNNSYKAEYYIKTNSISTNVYSSDIIEGFINLLPIDSKDIVCILNSDNEELAGSATFDSSIKNIDDFLKTDNYLYMRIITTEDLRNTEKSKFLESAIAKKIENSYMKFGMDIISISDTKNLENLKIRTKYIDIKNNYLDDGKVSKEIVGSTLSNDDISGLNIINLIKFKTSTFGGFDYDICQN